MELATVSDAVVIKSWMHIASLTFIRDDLLAVGQDIALVCRRVFCLQKTFIRVKASLFECI